MTLGAKTLVKITGGDVLIVRHAQRLWLSYGNKRSRFCTRTADAPAL